MSDTRSGSEAVGTQAGAGSGDVRLEDNADPRDEALTTLLKRLAEDAQTLIRQEIELAKTEVREQVEDAKNTAQQTVQRTKAEATSGVQRVKEEATENGKKAGTAIGMFAAAGVLGLFLLWALTYAAITALVDLGLPTWAASLIVALVYAIVIAILVAVAKKRLNDALPLVEPTTIQTTKDRITAEIQRGKTGVTENVPPVPEQTMETIKEDIEWAKNQPRSEKR